MGDKLTLADGPGAQFFPSAAFDGTSHLVSWSQATDSGNLTLTLRFFDRTGQPLGPEFSPIESQGTNAPIFGSPFFDGQKYLVTGVLAGLTNGFNASRADVYGLFVPRLPRLDALPPPGPGQFSLLLTGSPGFDYVIQMSTNSGLSNWVPLVTNSASSGSFSFTDSNATNSSRFDRAVTQ